MKAFSGFLSTIFFVCTGKDWHQRLDALFAGHGFRKAPKANSFQCSKRTQVFFCLEYLMGGRFFSLKAHLEFALLIDVDAFLFATNPDLGGRVMKSWKRDFLA